MMTDRYPTSDTLSFCLRRVAVKVNCLPRQETLIATDCVA